MHGLCLGLGGFFHFHFERLSVDVHSGDVALYLFNLDVVVHAVELILIIFHFALLFVG